MVWGSIVDAVTFLLTVIAIGMLAYLFFTKEARASDYQTVKGRPDVIHEVNLIRRKYGLLPVMETPFLDSFSQKRAQEAWPYRYKNLADGHKGFYQAAKTIKLRPNTWLGENLYTGPIMATGREIAVAWFRSPSHRDVLLHQEAVSCSASEVMDYRQVVVALNCAGE
jgi:uncharacterized protein YkwD